MPEIACLRDDSSVLLGVTVVFELALLFESLYLFYLSGVVHGSVAILWMTRINY